MKDPVIELRSVSKFYGQVMGLNDVSLRFRQGITGLLGPNGAGKSTMLKLITGQIRPSKGSVQVLGEDPWDNPGVYMKMGYCPEQDAFFRDMTGLSFVSFCGRLSGMGREEAAGRALRTMEMVGMEEDMDRPISNYSKGMRQRVKMAQALVHDPLLIVLDEPLAGTDPIGRMKIIELLFELERKGKNIIISSHVLHEVERMTENIVLIDNGKLVAEGNIHAIRDSLDRFPLTIRVMTPDARVLAGRLTSLEEVKTLSIGENGELLVRTSDPNRFYNDLQDLVVEDSFHIESIDSPDDNLNAVFEYLVE